MVIKIGKKLMDILRALVYEIFLQTFLEREKRNYCFFIFSHENGVKTLLK